MSRRDSPRRARRDAGAGSGAAPEAGEAREAQARGRVSGHAREDGSTHSQTHVSHDNDIRCGEIQIVCVYGRSANTRFSIGFSERARTARCTSRCVTVRRARSSRVTSVSTDYSIVHVAPSSCRPLSAPHAQTTHAALLRLLGSLRSRRLGLQYVRVASWPRAGGGGLFLLVVGSYKSARPPFPDSRANRSGGEKVEANIW